MNDSTDFEMDEQYLIHTFGTFSQNPSGFHFLRGEKSFIRQLVTHVNKIVDENGPNTGLERFKCKEKRKRKTHFKQSAQIGVRTNANDGNDATTIQKNDMSTQSNEPNELKTNLFGRIKNCLLKLHADVDVELLDESIVHVDKTQDKITGMVNCVVCKNNGKKKVYYDRVTGNWVITNFQKHLQSKHKLSQVDSDTKQQKIDIVDADNTNRKTNETETTAAHSINGNLKDYDNKSNSNVLNRTTVKIEKSENWLYNQLTAQINIMMQAVLESSEEEHHMAFKLNKNMHHLSVATISGDGNCLFAAIVHQLWQYPINSTKHKEATKQLRSEVVQYILANYESFEFNLKDRVYESKQKSQVTDMATECKSYVRTVLSCDGNYGGFETIAAVSEMFKVNILTFVEDDVFCFHTTKKIHGETIALAYRKGLDLNGQQIRNHYDSVYDVKPEHLLSISGYLNKQLK